MGLGAPMTSRIVDLSTVQLTPWAWVCENRNTNTTGMADLSPQASGKICYM
jgi:hypothetical protein